MKKFIFGILMVMSSMAFATTPCSWQVNWGYITDLTTLDTVRFKLIGGQTYGASTGEYILNLSSGPMFQENLTLINQAFFAGKQIRVNTVQCVGVPAVGTIGYIRISR